MKVHEITTFIEEFAPIGYQEGYDNCGLLIGSPTADVTGVLLCVDVTPEILKEALAKGSNLIISHHPLIFSGLKSITGSNNTEKIIIEAIKHNVAIYAAHTNIDKVWDGVSVYLAKKLGLQEIGILSPSPDQLVKLVVFVPEKQASEVRLAMFNAGAGHIGDYDQCSYNTLGTGTFRAGDSTNPYVGKQGELHHEKEVRVEVVVPKPILSHTIKAMQKAHPYEEVAYDIYPILNPNPKAGLGAVGKLERPYSEEEFLAKVKNILGIACIKHSKLLGKPIEKVALCGGSGSELLKNALKEQAQLFLTADVKYHNFFEAEERIIIADIGHYESEQLTIDIFYEILSKKMPNFAVHKTELNTNPINYL